MTDLDYQQEQQLRAFRDCERPAARQVRNQRTVRNHTQGETNAE